MKRSLLLLLGPSLFTALTTACTSGTDSPSTFEEKQIAYQACLTQETAALKQSSVAYAPKGPFSARLIASDASSVTRAVRDGVKASAHAQLETNRIQALAYSRCEPMRPRYEDYYGTGVAMDAGAAAPNSAARGGEGEDSNASAKEASTTNNQVAGVDEADFVKNDNKYIYVANGRQFRIIDAFPGSNMHEVASVELKGEAKKLFVEGNRAVVYSAVATSASSPGQYGNSSWWRPSECTYGQSGCVPAGDGTETEISVFDLTDRAHPQLVRSLHSSSSLIAARRIGNAVHTVLAQPAPFTLPSPYAPLGPDADEAHINEAYADLRAKIDASVETSQPNGSILPTWTDSASRAVNQAVFASSIPDGESLTSVLSFDLAANADVSVASVVSRPGWIYAAADALYMAVPHNQLGGWGWFDGIAETEASTIHKFTLGQTPAYFGSGLVAGRVLNQFAMDEQDGNLRVATTSGHLPDPKAHNTLTILAPQNGELTVAGTIENIAPGEDIRSVRFDGNRGYVVTFKKTDPLFVFDLADAHAPKILGELKIPGFSTYIHMMDATHLLTIGYDAADQGDFAWFTGIILQIFDVSNPTDPKLVHKETIGTRGTSSEAATNHLAFTYFAPKNLLALPMTICEGGNRNGGYGTNMTFSGLMVYDVTTTGGFKLRGKVAHPSVTDGARNTYGYYDQGCSNWWSNASSEVKRSIVMDSWVYSISDSRIKANALGDLATDVKEVAIGEELISQQGR